MLNFTGNVTPTTPTLAPSPQIVVPPITIPNGFTTRPGTPVVNQLTAKGKEAAKKIPLGPKSQVAIFEEDPDKDVFYFREVDEYGNDIEFSTYSYTKIEDPPEPEYLTKQEFYSAMDKFIEKLKEEYGNGDTVHTPADSGN